MPCIRSKPAWAATLANDNGRNPISFAFKAKTPDYFIPCGKCEACQVQKRMEWGIRMFHESQMHDRNCFVTLTYNEESCPEKINREDPQTFIKRLRHHSSRPIRYFLTGEYGDKTHRPHYHAILFGEDFLGGAYSINDELYGNKILDGIWKHGNTVLSEFTMSTAMYVSGYVAKKLDDTDTFSIMSRKPPLGREWVKKHKDNIRRLEKVIVDGRELPVPKVYLKWLEGVEEYDHIKENARGKVQTLNDRQCRAKELYLRSGKKLRSSKI